MLQTPRTSVNLIQAGVSFTQNSFCTFLLNNLILHLNFMKFAHFFAYYYSRSQGLSKNFQMIDMYHKKEIKQKVCEI